MLNSEIPELDGAGLRKFGVTTGVIVTLLFGLLLPWLLGHGYPLWPWVLGAILLLWAQFMPRTLAPVYAVWMRFGMVLGVVNTRIILFLLYTMVFVPVGLAFRVFGRDPMTRALTPGSADSYRTMSKKRDHGHFERPY
jgi:hypothetical protein